VHIWRTSAACPASSAVPFAAISSRRADPRLHRAATEWNCAYSHSAPPSSLLRTAECRRSCAGRRRNHRAKSPPS
jgi:hypothetical protein